MIPQAFASHIQVWIQEEIEAQRSIASALESQLNAVKRSSIEDVSESTQRLEEILRGNLQRDMKRKVLTEKFAKTQGFPPKDLSLGRLTELLDQNGVNTDALRDLRFELRDTVAAVLKLNRRIAVLARYHQGLYGEVLGVLADAAEGADAIPASGALIDARV